jgi:hypothetical protein
MHTLNVNTLLLEQIQFTIYLSITGSSANLDPVVKVDTL